MNSFLLETFNRLFKSRSPAFFIRMRVIFGLLTFANYIPSILQRWLGMEVPGPTITMCEDIAKYCTGIFAAMFLPAANPAVGKTVEGSAIQVTNESKFPFSAEKEKKKVEEEKPPLGVIPEVPETAPEIVT